MSINFGDGTSASFQARAQVTLKFDVGLTHTFPLPGCLTGCSPFFWMDFGGGGLRRFMSGSPVGRGPSPGPRGGKQSFDRAEPAPNINDLNSIGNDGDVIRITLHKS